MAQSAKRIARSAKGIASGTKLFEGFLEVRDLPTESVKIIEEPFQARLRCRITH